MTVYVVSNYDGIQGIFSDKSSASMCADAVTGSVNEHEVQNSYEQYWREQYNKQVAGR